MASSQGFETQLHLQRMQQKDTGFERPSSTQPGLKGRPQLLSKATDAFSYDELHLTQPAEEATPPYTEGDSIIPRQIENRDNYLKQLLRLCEQQDFQRPQGERDSDTNIDSAIHTDRPPLPRHGTGNDSGALQYSDRLELELEVIPDATPETCLWITKKPEFEAWNQDNVTKDYILTVLAGAGMGKSILAKSTVLNLRRKGQHVKAFFCSRKNQSHSNAAAAIASFVIYLCHRYRHLYRHFSEIPKDISIDKLWALFCELVSDDDVPQYTFVIDALDECTEETQKALHDVILADERILKTRILITSRPDNFPKSLGAKFVSISIDPKDSSEDAAKHIEKALCDKGIPTLYSSHMSDVLTQYILSDAEGMFLHVTFRLKELWETLEENRNTPGFSFSKESLEKFFDQMPRQFHDYYGMMIDDITDLTPPEINLAVVTFSSLLASQAGYLTDIYIASIWVTVCDDFVSDTKTLERIDLAIREKIQKICGAMLRMRQGDNDEVIIEFSHPTVRTYFERSQVSSGTDSRSKFLASISLQAGHLLLAKASLRFIQLPIFDDIRSSTLLENPFLAYAIVYWADHVKSCDSQVDSFREELRAFICPGSAAYREWAWIWRALFVKRQVFEFDPAEEYFPVAHCLAHNRLINVLNLCERGSERGVTAFAGAQIDLDVRILPSQTTALMMASAENKSDVVLALLEAGASLDIKDPDNGCHAIDYAVENNSLDSAKHLVDAGALGLITDSTNSVRLLFASVSASAAMFEILIGAGMTDFVDKSDSWTILHQAAYVGSMECAELICERGLVPDINVETTDGWTVLHAAAGAGKSLELVTYLISKGAEVNSIATNGSTPLFHAVNNGHVDIVRFLLQRKADPNMETDGWTPLQAAASDGHHDIIELLLEYKADLNTRNPEGFTALMLCISEEHEECARTLITAGAELNVKAGMSTTALWLACREKQRETVKHLLRLPTETVVEAGAMSPLHLVAWQGDLELTRLIADRRTSEQGIDEKEDSTGWTPLLAAISKGHTHVAQFLLKKGADCHVVSKTTRTALHMACLSTTSGELVASLLEIMMREEIDLVDSSGSTALHDAAGKGAVQVIKLLLAAGANPLLLDGGLCSPLHLAAISGSAPAVELLLTEAYLLDVQSSTGWTALHAASIRCSESIIERLAKSTNWLCRRRSVPTPLQLAVESNNVGATRALIRQGIRPELRSAYGSETLHIAIQQQNREIYELLMSAGAKHDELSEDNTLPLFWALSPTAIAEWPALIPSDTTLIRKSSYNLQRYIFRAAETSLAATRYFMAYEKLTCKEWLGETPLMVAAMSNQPAIVELLLDDGEMLKQVDETSLVRRHTALHNAAQDGQIEIMKLLLLKGKAKYRRDVLGLYPHDYCFAHDQGWRELQQHNNISFVIWARDLRPTVRTRIAASVKRLLTWLTDNHKEPQEDVSPGGKLSKEYFITKSLQYYSGRDVFAVIDALGDAFFILGDYDNGCTAFEYLFGTPSKKVTATFTCSICKKKSKSAGHWCTTCWSRSLCEECKQRSQDPADTSDLRGCRDHEYIEVPRKSWYTRSANEADEEGRTFTQWIEAVRVKYDEIVTMTSEQETDEAAFEIAYDVTRPSAVDLCWKRDIELLRLHFEQYLRDVVLTDSAGLPLSIIAIETASSDHGALELLSMLANEGTKMLTYSRSGESSVQVACRKRFRQCMVFILKHPDPWFDRVKDDFAPDILGEMIELGWNDVVVLLIVRHFDWVIHGDFAWVKELSLLGLEDQHLAEAVINTYGSRILHWTADRTKSRDIDPDPKWHSPGCSHIYTYTPVPPTSTNAHPITDAEEQSAPYQKMVDDPFTASREDYWATVDDGDDEDYQLERRGTDHSISSQSSTSDAVSIDHQRTMDIDIAGTFCGIAGIPPVRSHRIPYTVSKKDFVSGISVTKVSSSSNSLASNRTTDASVPDILMINVVYGGQDVRETLNNAGRGILAAIKASQSAGTCCNGFTILTSGQESNIDHPAVVSNRITVDLVKDFVNRCGKESDATVDRFAMAILSSCALLPDASESSLLEIPLEMTCLAMQVLSLGFLAFSGAYSPEIWRSVLSHGVETYRLGGCTGAHFINLQRVPMACIRDMLGDDILAFSNETRRMRSPRQNEVKPASCLEISIANLLEMFGPGTLIHDDSAGVGDDLSNLVQSVYLQGGYVTITSAVSEVPIAHWSISHPETTQFFRSFSIDDRLLIGMEVNRRCQLSHRESSNKAEGPEICTLDTRDSYWTMESFTSQLGFSQYVAANAQFGFKKHDDKSKKHSIMKSWRLGDLQSLNGPWGVKVSICTGIAQRVPLREVIAETMPYFLETVDLSVHCDHKGPPRGWHWQREELRKMLWGSPRRTDAENNRRFLDYYNRSRDDNTQRYIRASISFVLIYLSLTGLDDSETNFKIAWPDWERNIARGFEFPLSHPAANWARILKNNRQIATFAIATSECLISKHSPGPFAYSACRCPESTRRRETIVYPLVPNLLATRVTTCAGRRWELRTSSNYSFRTQGAFDVYCRCLSYAGDERKFLVVTDDKLVLTSLVLQNFFLTLECLQESDNVNDGHRSVRHKTALICSATEWLARINY